MCRPQAFPFKGKATGIDDEIKRVRVPWMGSSRYGIFRRLLDDRINFLCRRDPFPGMVINLYYFGLIFSFGIKRVHSLPEELNTSIEGILGVLKPNALHPYGCFFCQVTKKCAHKRQLTDILLKIS